MTKAGASVARQVGILATAPRQPGQLAMLPDTLDWRTLVKEGAVQRLLIKPEEVGLQAAPEPYIDLWFGYLNAPAIGRHPGADAYEPRVELGQGEHALLIIGSGRESFKGSGFVRGGLFDRVQVTQEVDTYVLRPRQNLYSLVASGHRHSGVSHPDHSQPGSRPIRGTSPSSVTGWTLNRASTASPLSTRNTGCPTVTLSVGGQVPWVEPGWFKPWQTRPTRSSASCCCTSTALIRKRDSIVRQQRLDKRVLGARTWCGL